MVVENTHRLRTLLKLFQLAGLPAPSASNRRWRPAVVLCAVERLEERALFSAGPIGPKLPLDQAPVGVHRDAGGGPGVVWPRADGGGSGKAPGHDQGNGKDQGGGKGDDGSGHQGDGKSDGGGSGKGDGGGSGKGDGGGSGKGTGSGKGNAGGSANGDNGGSGKADGGSSGKSDGGNSSRGTSKSNPSSGSGNATGTPTGSPGSTPVYPASNHSFALLTTAGSTPWISTGPGNSSPLSSSGGQADLSLQSNGGSSATGLAASSGASADIDADSSSANPHARAGSTGKPETSPALSGASKSTSPPAPVKFLTQPADSLFAASVTLPGLDFGRLGQELDALGSQLDSAARTHTQEIALAAALSAAASVGYALWNLNQGRLARAALAGAPLAYAFDQFDPLAYLDFWEKSRR